MADLSRKRSRDRLAPRREPYWQRLDAGAYLGFRPGTETWLARLRGLDRKQQHHALGEALEFDEAKRSSSLCAVVEAPARQAAPRSTRLADSDR